jgi:hypothetical protein
LWSISASFTWSSQRLEAAVEIADLSGIEIGFFVVRHAPGVLDLLHRGEVGDLAVAHRLDEPLQPAERSLVRLQDGRGDLILRRLGRQDRTDRGAEQRSNAEHRATDCETAKAGKREAAAG